MPPPGFRTWRGRVATGLAIGFGAALLSWGLSGAELLERIELMTYDWRMRLTASPDAPSPDIVLVSINDDTIRRMAPVAGRWPWPRLVHSYVIDYLARAPAKVVAYDVLFTEPDIRGFNDGAQDWSGAESDAALAASVSAAGNVVTAADVAAEALLDRTKRLPSDAGPVRQYGNVGACVEPRDVLVPPLPDLNRASREVGHTLMLRDPDGPLRRHHPFVRVDGRVVPSLAMAAAMVALGRVPSPPGGTATCPPLIPYRGPTVGPERRPTFQEYSFYTLFVSEQQLLAGEPPALDPSVFADKVVVVSATASGTYEVQSTPFNQGIAGGEVHANIIDALLRNRTIERSAAATRFTATMVPALAVGALGAVLPVWPLAMIAAGSGAGLVWLGLRAFGQGLWLPLAGPLLAVGLAFVGQLAWQYLVEGREKRQVKRLLSRYVPRDVFEQLMADPSRAALGGSRRYMTVLFSDVRGFTTLSEQAQPEELVGQLNEYFSRMVEVLFEHGGTLDKFVGDAVMGMFGAPLDDPDHADHAVRASLGMIAALDELNRRWAAEGRPALDIGIGVSTGEMVAGNIGSAAIMSYTVIGDAVNLGARLEGLNKEYGTRIIISESTRNALAARYDIHPLGEVIVKGKSRPVAIFEVRPST